MPFASRASRRSGWIALSLAAHAAAVAALTSSRAPRRTSRPLLVAVAIVRRPPAERLVQRRPGAGPGPDAGPGPSRPPPRPDRRVLARSQRRSTARAADDGRGEPPLAPAAASAERPVGGGATTAIPSAALAGALATAPPRWWVEPVSREEDGASVEAAWARERLRVVEAHLQSWMDRTPYPSGARRMGWFGIVRLAFTVHVDGSVSGIRIVHSSGHAVLDRCAIEVLRAAAPLPSPPRDEEITVPFEFWLR